MGKRMPPLAERQIGMKRLMEKRGFDMKSVALRPGYVSQRQAHIVYGKLPSIGGYVQVVKPTYEELRHTLEDDLAWRSFLIDRAYRLHNETYGAENGGTINDIKRLIESSLDTYAGLHRQRLEYDLMGDDERVGTLVGIIGKTEMEVRAAWRRLEEREDEVRKMVEAQYGRVWVEPDEPDALDEMIAERTLNNPGFPAMVEDARARRAALREGR